MNLYLGIVRRELSIDDGEDRVLVGVFSTPEKAQEEIDSYIEKDGEPWHLTSYVDRVTLNVPTDIFL